MLKWLRSVWFVAFKYKVPKGKPVKTKDIANNLKRFSKKQLIKIIINLYIEIHEYKKAVEKAA